MRAVFMAMALMVAVTHHTVSAHTSHGVDEDTAITIVQDTVPQLVVKDFGFEVGQLDESWNLMAESHVSVVETDGDFYIMQATNPESEETIFFLIGINGQVLEAKHSNDF